MKFSNILIYLGFVLGPFLVSFILTFLLKHSILILGFSSWGLGASVFFGVSLIISYLVSTVLFFNNYYKNP